MVAWQRTLHVLYLLSITFLQNIANTLFDTIGVMKGPLLYCFRFEMVFNSWLLVMAELSHIAERRSSVA